MTTNKIYGYKLVEKHSDYEVYIMDIISNKPLETNEEIHDFMKNNENYSFFYDFFVKNYKVEAIPKPIYKIIWDEMLQDFWEKEGKVLSKIETIYGRLYHKAFRVFEKLFPKKAQEVIDKINRMEI